MRIDRTKTLTQLEHHDWGEDPKVTGLISRCYNARKIPLKDITVENLRLLIGQDISTEILVPLALEILQNEPLAAGDFYPGDLLVSVMRLPATFWDQHTEMKQVLETIVSQVLDEADGGVDRKVVETIHQYQNGTLPTKPSSTPARYTLQTEAKPSPKKKKHHR